MLSFLFVLLSRLWQTPAALRRLLSSWQAGLNTSQRCLIYSIPHRLWLFNQTLYKTEPVHQMKLPELCRLLHVMIINHNFRCGWLVDVWAALTEPGDLFHSGGNESLYMAASLLYALSSGWIHVCMWGERERGRDGVLARIFTDPYRTSCLCAQNAPCVC